MTYFRTIFTGLCLLLPLALPAEKPAPVKEVPTAAPIRPTSTKGMPPVVFKRFLASIEPGEDVGFLESGVLFADSHKLTWDKIFLSQCRDVFFRVVHKELESAGYPVPRKREEVFDTGQPETEDNLELGALVRAMRMHLHRGNRFKGEVYLDVKWALFDPRCQRVIYEGRSEGFARTGPVDLAWEELLANAAASSTRNLLANGAFLAALQRPREGAVQSAGAAFAIPSTPPPSGGTAKNATMLAAAVVTVESDQGSGTGFYLSREGHILTCAHVAGRAKFVRVRTSTGRELPGEVLAADPKRDVALVKTQSTPFDPLSPRRDNPKVGDEVYALGSPLGNAFSGTLTRGVIGGLRDLDGMSYLQSDVSCLPGSSGGPLLDATGSVIGITDLGVKLPGGSMNFFIPIGDALTHLSIQVKPDLAPTP